MTVALRTASAVVAIVIAAAAVAGCSDHTAPHGSALTVRVIVPDVQLRPPGSVCYGTGAFADVNPSGSFRLAAGRSTVTGSVPAGQAAKAYDKDFGHAAKVPTVCVLALTMASVPAAVDYTLTVSGQAPVSFSAAQISGRTVTVTLPE